MDAHAELADLQNRFHLLEGDRKAFYEQKLAKARKMRQATKSVAGDIADADAKLAALGY